MDNVLLAYVWAAPLLALIGVAWAPFAVAIGLGGWSKAGGNRPRSAERWSFRHRDGAAFHNDGVPVDYLFAHWIGKPVPHRFIRFGYAVLYVRWFFAPIWLGVYASFREIIDDVVRMREETISASVFVFIFMIILTGLNSYILFRSLRSLLKRKSIIGAQRILAFHSNDFYYLKPMFVWLIVEVGMLITGIFTAFAYWAYSLSTVGP